MFYQHVWYVLFVCYVVLPLIATYFGGGIIIIIFLHTYNVLLSINVFNIWDYVSAVFNDPEFNNDRDT